MQNVSFDSATRKGIVNGLPPIERLVAKRPTYGYLRITAVLNCELTRIEQNQETADND